MKQVIFIIAAVLLLLVGCGSQEEAKQPEKVVKTEETPAASVEKKEEAPAPAVVPPQEAPKAETPAPAAADDISDEGLVPAEEPVEDEQVSLVAEETMPNLGDVI
ncbi:hypothetical protein HY639_00785 [Candidatus Woesearchaeota archaeon]|nr:hypothetical protein [Candidatus Woesearchaeota archaeon]